MNNMLGQQLEVNKSTNKKFGVLLTCVFAVVGTWCFYTGNIFLGYVFMASSVCCLVVTCIWPNSFEKLATIWLYFGWQLGRVVNPIVLGIIFFGIMSPIGIFMRFFGRDVLQLKPMEQEGFWQNCENTKELKNRFEKQF